MRQKKMRERERIPKISSRKYWNNPPKTVHKKNQERNVRKKCPPELVDRYQHFSKDLNPKSGWSNQYAGSVAVIFQVLVFTLDATTIVPLETQ